MISLPILRNSAPLRYFTFFYLYAMQGVPAGFALTALANYLIGKGVDALTIGSFDAIIGIPWIINFIWGAVIDRYQFSLMGLRKHWIIFSQFLALLTLTSLLFVHDPVKQVHVILAIFFTHSIFASVQDASVDALAIAIVPVNQQGRINAFMRVGMVCGVAIGAAVFSTLVHFYGFYYAAAAQVIFLLIFTVVTYIIKVDREDSYIPSFHTKPIEKAAVSADDNPDLKWLFRQLYNGFVNKISLKTFSVIALIYLCLSVFIKSFSFHLIHNLHWDDNNLSILQGTWGSLVTVVVVLCGGVFADRLGAPRMLRIVTYAICGFLLFFGLLGMWWHYKSLSVTGMLIYSLADPMYSIAAIPVLMALCLKKVEASQFTTYMAVVNLCDVLGAYISGLAMRVTTAPVIGVTCGLVISTALCIQWLLRPAKQLAT
ncbi:MFS transporter [Mucilaginibacter ginkgonis]|uniref:MFS transporter n=1 Tax=Mucilaginibacter ginkgonis TaxID=2682091 RepID=A0A7T7FA47_9SPHI|nr:MFS transporter [Mucilaginibacter ginkgonis]QQL49605.1 MFS transporter [Mucilaginibacter ginkgonis]